MKVQLQGSSKSVDFGDATFGASYNEPLVHQVVTAYLAGQRAGTKAQKRRSDVRGGGTKPWRQKGTGRARAGSIRSPLWSGGGTVFGPHPRDYGYRMSRQSRRTALKSALAQKLREERLTIVDRIALAESKTKHVVAMLAALQIADSVLLVIEAPDARVERAARNIPEVKVLRAEGLNVYDLLHYHHLVMTTAAVEAVTKRVTA
jgi:large subunit ribosomal protein L4